MKITHIICKIIKAKKRKELRKRIRDWCRIQIWYKIYLKVSELYKEVEEIEMMCEEYKKALELAGEYPEEKEKIQQLIKDNCE